MKRRKFSPTFEKDYAFYLSQRHHFTFSGSDIRNSYKVEYSETGKTAKQCFHKLDSEGKLLPCSEPDLLYELLTCKAAVNMQIKIWAQSRAEYTLSFAELQEYMEYYQAPEWVLKAVENQKARILRAQKNEHPFYKDAAVLNFGEALERIRLENSGASSSLPSGSE